MGLFLGEIKTQVKSHAKELVGNCHIVEFRINYVEVFDCVMGLIQMGSYWKQMSSTPP